MRAWARVLVARGCIFVIGARACARACVCVCVCVQEYYLTFPTYYAHGLLVGTLRMEIGDSLHIVCKKTGLRADIDFHQKPTFGGADKHNALDGHIRRIPAAGAEPGAWHRACTRHPRPVHKACVARAHAPARPRVCSLQLSAVGSVARTLPWVMTCSACTATGTRCCTLRPLPAAKMRCCWTLRTRRLRRSACCPRLCKARGRAAACGNSRPRS
ncbi:hypothetical protein EON67_02570 [archaeon]|nr:MAG: hypothetical protein EON67_02570 [archaeon]